MKKTLERLYRFSNSWTGTIIIVLMIIFFLAQAFVIPSGSMKNTLHEGDYLLVKKFTYGVPIPHLPWVEIPLLPDIFGNGHLKEGSRPLRGEIVVFRFPHAPKIHYVKRNVAVGGDGVMGRGDSLYLRPHEGDTYIRQNFPKEQIVTINGELWVKDPYLHKHPGVRYDYRAREQGILPPETSNFGPLRVPEDQFFMVGDNRDHSNDSRFWGSVPYKYIVGKPWFIYFSWDSRSYEEVANRGIFLTDYEAIEAVCGDLDPFSSACEAKWERQRFKIRWDRIGQGMRGLERLLR